MFSIILSRKHYTIDIVIAYYLSSRIFYIYHTLLKIRDRESNLNRVFWYPLFRYFENDKNDIKIEKNTFGLHVL